MSLDPVHLSRVNLQQIYQNPIFKLKVDPLTSLITTSENEFRIIEVIKREKNYLYVELGKYDRATLAI